MLKRHQLNEQEKVTVVLSKIRFSVNKISMRQIRKFYTNTNISKLHLPIFLYVGRLTLNRVSECQKIK